MPAQRNGFGGGSFGGSALGASTTPAANTNPGATVYQGANAPSGQDFGQTQMIGKDSMNQAGGFQSQFAPSGQIQTSVENPGVPVTSVGQGEMYQQKMQDAYMDQARSRLDPMWTDKQNQLEGQLANMGLSRGTAAWDREMQNLSQGRNDAYGGAINQAILNSGAEAQRMQGMELAAGNFANSAAGQQFGQNLQQGQFGNQAQNQGYTQDLGRGQFNNAALQAQQAAAQGWGQQATQRYGSDQSRAGQENAAASSASGMVGAASASANASMTNAQLAADLQARQIANAEQLQNFNMSRTAAYDIPGLQNAYMQGMSPTGSPTYQQAGTMQPTTQNSSQYASGLTGAQNQQNQGMGSILSSLGGFLPF